MHYYIFKNRNLFTNQADTENILNFFYEIPFVIGYFLPYIAKLIACLFVQNIKYDKRKKKRKRFCVLKI